MWHGKNIVVEGHSRQILTTSQRAERDRPPEGPGQDISCKDQFTPTWPLHPSLHQSSMISSSYDSMDEVFKLGHSLDIQTINNSRYHHTCSCQSCWGCQTLPLSQLKHASLPLALTGQKPKIQPPAQTEQPVCSTRDKGAHACLPGLLRHPSQCEGH